MSAGKIFKWILIISLILLIIFSIAAIFWGNKMPLVKKTKWANAKWMNSLRCNMNLDKSLCKVEKPEYISIYLKSVDSLSGVQINSEFILKEGSSIRLQGKLSNNYWEEYKDAIYNDTYELIAWDDDNQGDDYYYDEIKCNPLEKKSYCTIQLDKQGTINLEIHELKEDQYTLRLSIKEGTIRDPILCLNWKPFINILGASIDEEMMDTKPFELRLKYDKCYNIETMTAAREPPLSRTELIKEVTNLHMNCSFVFSLTLNQTIKEIKNLYGECESKPNLKKEDIIQEYMSMYKFCLLQKKSQRDLINSFASLYEKCDTKEDIKPIKDITLTINKVKDLTKDDKMEFIVLDRGDYRDGNDIEQSYFGINEKDIGIPNFKLEKNFE